MYPEEKTYFGSLYDLCANLSAKMQIAQPFDLCKIMKLKNQQLAKGRDFGLCYFQVELFGVFLACKPSSTSSSKL